MTVTPEALEALADRLDAGDPSSLSTASNMLDAIAKALRTGQLVLIGLIITGFSAIE